MSNPLHSKQTAADGLHSPIAFEYTNAAARTAATGFSTEDLNKFAKQLDDNSVWMLLTTTPTWVRVDGASGVTSSRTLTAGAGLTGGGDLTSDRTFNVVGNVDGSISVNANDIQVGVLASDSQHGARGGGSLHPDATTLVSGFFTGAEKTKLIGVEVGATNTPLSSSTPQEVGTASAGSDTSASKSDHVHAHGNQGGGSLHPDATTLVSGFFTGAEKTKLSGLPTSAIPTSEKGAANGVATLDGGTKIPASQLPAIAISDTFIAASQVAMLALSAQTGDVAVRTDINETFILSGTNPTVLGDWTQLLHPVIASLSNAAPLDLGTASPGVSTLATREGHVHAHGNQAGGSLHADATTLVSGFFTGTEKTKLIGIATGATNTPLSASTPQAVGTASPGSDTSASKSDHVHDHGNQLGGALHALAVANVSDGFISGSDQARLSTLTQNFLIYRPGSPPSPGVVTTWPEVETFNATTEVPWTLFCDSVYSPVTVPATANTDFKGLCTISFVPSPSGTELTVLDGGAIRNITGVEFGAIICEATTAPGIIIDKGGIILVLQLGGGIANLSTSLFPALSMEENGLVIACRFGGRLLDQTGGTVPLVNYTVIGSFNIVASIVNTNGGSSAISDNVFQADGTSFLLFIHDCTDVVGTQTFFGGFVQRVNTTSSNLLGWVSGNTAGRPVALVVGQPYFDTDLGFPVWWNGTNYVSAAGVIV